MAISARVIPSGGSVTLSPCRLAAVDGKITDKWGRQYHSPPGGLADFGAGTAPAIAGLVTADADSVVYFDFG